jgi:chromosome segregation ATPase
LYFFSKKAKKTLTNELVSMAEEIEEQTKQKERLEQEVKEMQEARAQLKDNMDDLKEQMLRVDLTLSPGSNERIRLEQDYYRY